MPRISIPPKQTNIILVGDIMLGRTVMTKSQDVGDFTYPFLKVSGELNQADLVFANLENPIVTNCPRHTDGLKFCATPDMLAGLVGSNITAVTLSNNHTLNYGQSGLEETKQYLAQNNILYTYKNLVIIKKNNLKFGFLGFDFLDNTPTEADYDLIKASKQKVDILIVSIHWGVEYTAHPTAYQKEIAQKVIESGGDILMGHHPHWVQDTESINGKPVYYSLGNFVFDQMWSEETRHGLAIKLTFDEKGKLITEEKLPIYMSNWAQPEFIQ